jgi:hypothetical protein
MANREELMEQVGRALQAIVSQAPASSRADLETSLAELQAACPTAFKAVHRSDLGSALLCAVESGIELGDADDAEAAAPTPVAGVASPTENVSARIAARKAAVSSMVAEVLAKTGGIR